MHNTTSAQEGTDPGKSHLLELANEFRLRHATEIIEQVTDAISQWKFFANDVGVTKESMDLIEKQLQGILKL